MGTKTQRFSNVSDMVSTSKFSFGSHCLRLAFSLLTGALLGAAFLNAALAWLAWLAPGLILWSAHGKTRQQTFFAGWAAGFGYFLVSVYWLLLIPLPWQGVAGYLGLSVVGSFFVGVWCWICWWLVPSRGAVSNVGKAAKNKRLHSVSPPIALLSSTLKQLLLWPLLCAMAWVVLEMTWARAFGGFPWNLLGPSQFGFLPLLQIASITGVYGVSFLIAWTSFALIGVFATIHWRTIWLSRRPDEAPEENSAKSKPSGIIRWLAMAGLQLSPPGLALVATTLFGINQLAQPNDATATLKIALVQPSVSQLVIWDSNQKTNRLNKILELSRAGLAERPNLLVWPEAAASGVLGRNRFTQETIANLLRGHGAWMVFGGTDTIPKFNSTQPGEVEGFNAAFLIDPQGELIERYYKNHLVAFGEFMPFARQFPFLAKLRSAGAGMVPGERRVEFIMDEPRAKFSTLICYEDVFAHEVRERVDTETDFLLNLTNDGWFGDSAAQWQHARTALFRAIENGLPLVRCANNGLTCWIDSRGRIHETYFPGSKNVYEAGVKIVEIPLRSSSSTQQQTFYHRHGDLFGWSCVAIIGVAALIPFFRRGELRAS